MDTYNTIHQILRRTVGSASDYTCDCGKRAEDWAYQFTAGDQELRNENGSGPHSLDPADYAPMCHSCHVKFDLENDPYRADNMRTRLAQNTAAIAQRRLTDPEFGENNRKNILAVNKRRRRCTECGRVSNPAGMGAHLKSTGHTGWVGVE